MTMQGIAANDVLETTETQGTGNYALEGPVVPYGAFSAAIGHEQLVTYVCQQLIKNGEGEETGKLYERGLGRVHHGAPDEIERVDVFESSNGDAAVDWGPGTKTIFATPLAQNLPMMAAPLAAARDGRPLVVAAGSRFFAPGNVSLGQQAATTLTIASGVVTPVQAAHVVDTQGEAASDDLTTISTANIADGGLLVLTSAHPARSVVLKHESSPSPGQIFLLTEKEYTLNNTRKSICLQRRGDHWVELWRGEGLLPLDSLAGLTENHLIVGNDDNRPAAVSFAAVNRLAGKGPSGAFGPMEVLRRGIFGEGTFDIAGVRLHWATKSDVFTTGSTSFTDVTGLSITLTPKSVSSKFLLFFFGSVGNTNSSTLNAVRFMRGSTPIGIGDAVGSRTRASAAMRQSGSAWNDTLSSCCADEPATASAVTYKMQMMVSAGTGVLGRFGLSDTNDAGHAITPSALVVIEIEGGNQ